MRKCSVWYVLLLLIGFGIASANTNEFPANGEWYVVEFGEYDDPIELIKTEYGYQESDDIKYSRPFYLTCSADLHNCEITISTTTIYRGSNISEDIVYRYYQLSDDSWICYVEDVSSLTKRDMVSGYYFENVMTPDDPFHGSRIYEFSTEISSHQHKYLLVDGHIYPNCNQYDRYYYDGTNLFLIQENGYLSNDLFAYGNDVFMLKATRPYANENKPIVGSYLFIRDR